MLKTGRSKTWEVQVLLQSILCSSLSLCVNDTSSEPETKQRITVLCPVPMKCQTLEQVTLIPSPHSIYTLRHNCTYRKWPFCGNVWEASNLEGIFYLQLMFFLRALRKGYFKIFFNKKSLFRLWYCLTL